MTQQTYRETLRQLQAELADAVRQRDALNIRISQLERNAAGMAIMVARENVSQRAAVAQRAHVSLADGIVAVVRSTGQPMHPLQVRNALMAIGFNLSVFSNPMAAIHNALKRLVHAGTLVPAPEVKGYRIKPNPFYGE